jgi:riboflavin kinase/FMN adenylyltransferase
MRSPSLDAVRLRSSWLTIGIFDGVHRGHQQILHRLVEGAHAAQAVPVVLTFSPHPAVVLGGKKNFPCLTTLEERVALLEGLGVEVVITQLFDHKLAAESAEDFMGSLAGPLGLRRLLVGYDFALGRDREGNAQRLIAIGQNLGYIVETIPVLSQAGHPISSTSIRAEIMQGAVEAAGRDLGRPYALAGEVVHGDGRGRTISIPTANIQVDRDKVLPADGVYAAWAWVQDGCFPAVINIGIRPTFSSGGQTAIVEAHLPGFERDLYGQVLKLDLVARLRGETKFPTVEALVAQIHTDIEQAGVLLKEAPAAGEGIRLPSRGTGSG